MGHGINTALKRGGEGYNVISRQHFKIAHLEALLLLRSPLIGVVDRAGVGEYRGSGEAVPPRPPPFDWHVHL